VRRAHLDGLVSREQLLGLLTALDGGMNDDLVSLLPVDRGGDSVLVAHLEGIDDSYKGMRVLERVGLVQEGSDVRMISAKFRPVDAG
jgi:hypothetical protein